MSHAMYGTPVGDWRCICQESFGLQPRQLGTLAAIVAYSETTGEPMPAAELTRYARTADCEGYYRLDPGCASALAKMALVTAVGPQNARAWAPTRAGVRRLGA